MNKIQVENPKVVHNGWAKKRIEKFSKECVELGGEDYKAMLGQGTNVDYNVTHLGVANTRNQPSNKRKERVTEVTQSLPLIQEPPKRPRAQNQIKEVDPRQGGQSAWMLAAGALALMSKFV